MRGQYWVHTIVMTRVSKPSGPLPQRQKKTPALLKQFAPTGTRISPLIGRSKTTKLRIRILPPLSIGMLSAASAWEKPTSGYPRNLAGQSAEYYSSLSRRSFKYCLDCVHPNSFIRPSTLRYEITGLIEPYGAERRAIQWEI